MWCVLFLEKNPSGGVFNSHLTEKIISPLLSNANNYHYTNKNVLGISDAARAADFFAK